MAHRNLARFGALAAVAGLLMCPAYAQKAGTVSTGTGSSAGSSAGSLGSRTGATGTTGTTTNGTPTTNPSPSVTGPIFLSGRVVMDDGSPLPEPVTIERVCNGTTHSEGYTDTKGNFGIQLGNEQGVFQDATDGIGRSGGTGMPGGAAGLGSSSGALTSSGSSQERLLTNCELRARLGGYRSQSVILAGRRVMDNPDVGTILLHRETAGEGSTVSVTSLQAPKDARKAFEKGLEYAKKNKWAEARVEYEKAVQIYQGYAAAWCELGKMQAGSDDLDMARGSFRMAIQSDPKFPVPYLELSTISVEQKKWQEVSDLSTQAIKLNPFDYPQAYLYNAAAHYNLRETESAEKSVLEAERLDTRHQYPQLAHLHGLILAQKQDFAGAVEHLRDYLKMVPDAVDAAVVRTQLAQYDHAALAQK